jgi:Cell division GTPase
MEEVNIKEYGFLALGAYGGNQCLPFYKKGYPVLFVNTATVDLESLTDVQGVHKYHIAGGQGCNKDRNKSKQIFRDNIDNIVNEVKDKLQGIKVLFIVGSAGGGTSSGVLPSMKRIMANELDITVCIVTVLPSTRNESVKALLNCYETMSEIDQLEECGATFVLDNDKNGNKLRINDMFYCYLDALLTNNSSSVLGNVDRAEVNELLATKGMAIISKLGKDKSDTEQLISTFKNNVYAPLEEDRVIKYVGLINSGSGIRIEDVYKEVGTPFDKYEGYEAPSTICMLAGLSLPYTKLAEIKEIIDGNKETIKRNLTSPEQSKLTGGIGFFDDVVPDKPKPEKKKSNRGLLFI